MVLYWKREQVRSGSWFDLRIDDEPAISRPALRNCQGISPNQELLGTRSVCGLPTNATAVVIR